jgi:pyridoxine kinase
MPSSVLSISSQVAFGPVGNSATVPAMEALGLTVFPVPTIVLAHHPGHGKPAGFRVPAADLASMLKALLQLGALDGLTAVLTGYFASSDQILVAAEFLEQMKRRSSALFYLCDPVIGCETSNLYVPLAVAEAVKTALLPLADILTPNSFELGWLSGAPVKSVGDVEAARLRLEISSLIAKSVPRGEDRLLTVLTGSLGEAVVETRRLSGVPHGTGDVFAGLFLGHLLQGMNGPASLQRTMTALNTVIDVSAGSTILNLSVLRKMRTR